MATKKTAKTEAVALEKTEAVEIERFDDEVEIFIPVDYSTDEEMLYVAVNGVGINIPFGEKVKVKSQYASEINRRMAQLEANRKKSAEQKRNDDAYTSMYINSTT